MANLRSGDRLVCCEWRNVGGSGRRTTAPVRFNQVALTARPVFFFFLIQYFLIPFVSIAQQCFRCRNNEKSVFFFKFFFYDSSLTTRRENAALRTWKNWRWKKKRRVHIITVPTRVYVNTHLRGVGERLHHLCNAKSIMTHLSSFFHSHRRRDLRATGFCPQKHDEQRDNAFRAKSDFFFFFTKKTSTKKKIIIVHLCCTRWLTYVWLSVLLPGRTKRRRPRGKFSASNRSSLITCKNGQRGRKIIVVRVF